MRRLPIKALKKLPNDLREQVQRYEEYRQSNRTKIRCNLEYPDRPIAQIWAEVWQHQRIAEKEDEIEVTEVKEDREHSERQKAHTGGDSSEDIPYQCHAWAIRREEETPSDYGNTMAMRILMDSGAGANVLSREMARQLSRRGLLWKEEWYSHMQTKRKNARVRNAVGKLKPVMV